MTATRNDDSSKPLNDKQQRFVLEYLQDQNAAAAARRAGYSDSTRGSHAAALMKNPLIQESINTEMAALFARLRVSAFNILQAQARAAFFDPRKMFDAEGEPVPISQLDDDTACALNVNYDQGPRGKTLRVRQAPRHVALAALENRYAAFLDMELRAMQMRGERQAVAEEDTDEQHVDTPEPITRAEAAGPQPAPVQPASVPHPILASRAARRAAARNANSGNCRQSGLLHGLLASPPARESTKAGSRDEAPNERQPLLEAA